MIAIPGWLAAFLALVPFLLPVWDILKVRFGLVPAPAPGQPATPFFDQLTALIGVGCTRDEVLAEIRKAFADGKIDTDDLARAWQFVNEHPAYPAPSPPTPTPEVRA